MNIPRKYSMLAAFVGGFLILGLSALLWISHRHNAALREQLAALQSQATQNVNAPGVATVTAGPGVATSPVDQLVKDLSTRFVGDPRTHAQKLRDYVSSPHADANTVAIAAKVIADFAGNSDALGNDDLRWLYQQELPMTLKRVAAQVLSYRRDNQLIDMYIAQFTDGLGSHATAEHRAALSELGKTRYHRAADLILPSLTSDDVTVLLDALLALNLTGNERHVPAVQALLEHQDDSVKWQAKEVLNNLELLSGKARVHISLAEVGAEIPILSL